MDVLTSGNWLVKQGEDGEFVRRWREWLEWTRENAQGFKWAKLVRSTDDPRRFISIALWENEKARADWRDLGEFRQNFEDLKALCDEFVGGDYNGEVAI